MTAWFQSALGALLSNKESCSNGAAAFWLAKADTFPLPAHHITTFVPAPFALYRWAQGTLFILPVDAQGQS